jgi:hypothetical protein
VDIFVSNQIDIDAVKLLGDMEMDYLELPMGPRLKLKNAIKLLNTAAEMPHVSTHDLSAATTPPAANPPPVERLEMVPVPVSLSRLMREEFTGLSWTERVGTSLRKTSIAP